MEPPPPPPLEMAIRDYDIVVLGNIHPSIQKPTLNFNIKTSQILFVQQDQFSGLPMEDPNDHINIFLEKCNTFKVNEVPKDAIMLRLFPFSLRDKAKSWLKDMEANSFSTWDELAAAFLRKYFPPGKIAKLRTDIISFTQLDGESLYEAWERFKDVQRKCPNHGVPEWHLIQTFYNGLNHTVRLTIDAAAGGALMGKSTSVAKALLEEMASNNYHWSSDKGRTTENGGKYEVDNVTLLASKIDALAQRIRDMNMPNQLTGSSMNQVNAFQTYNPRPPQNNPYSNTIYPNLKNHPYFSYQNNNPQPSNFSQSSGSNGYEEDANMARGKFMTEGEGVAPSSYFQPYLTQMHSQLTDIRLEMGRVLGNQERIIDQQDEIMHLMYYGYEYHNIPLPAPDWRPRGPQ